MGVDVSEAVTTSIPHAPTVVAGVCQIVTWEKGASDLKVFGEMKRKEQLPLKDDPRDTNRYYYTIRPMVYGRARGRCYACDRRIGRNWECHHIRPVRRGGTNELKNLVCLCLNCHGFVHGNCRYKRRLKKRVCFVA